MSQLMLFNKPFNVLSQFTPVPGRQTLADFIDKPGYYAAGRLDRDSEGLMLLTNDGRLQHRISHPDHKLEKRYLVQVEGRAIDEHLQTLRRRVELKDGPARASHASLAQAPTELWPRDPPIRHRARIPTSWINIGLTEGRNRQVRRMTAAVGLPTLRLVRIAIGSMTVWDLPTGHYRLMSDEILGHQAQRRQRPPRPR